MAKTTKVKAGAAPSITWKVTYNSGGDTITAESLTVADGTLIFMRGGLVYQAIAPGTWKTVLKIVPEGEG